MIIDMRYHLVSLVAVFLALGLGILVGIALNSDGRLLEEQASLIDAVESQLEKLRADKVRLEAESRRANAELAAYQEFVARTLPLLIEGKLVGVAVTLLHAPDEGPLSGVVEILQTAGAEVLALTIAPDTDLEAVAEAITKAAGKHTAVLLGGDGMVGQAGRLLAMLGQKSVPAVAAGHGDWLQQVRQAGGRVVEGVETAMGRVNLIFELLAAVSADRERRAS